MKFVRSLICQLFVLFLLCGGAAAQDVAGPRVPTVDAGLLAGASYESRPSAQGPGGPSGMNPLYVLDEFGDVLSGGAGASRNVPIGDGGGDPESGLSVAVNIMVLLTVISLVPSIMLMTTCFLRIMIVLSLLRQAMGVQTIPPAQVITGLALMLTAMVMAPTIDRVWTEAVEPWQAGEISSYDELWDRAKQPMRDYMFDQIEATNNVSSILTLLDYRDVDISDPSKITRADVDMSVLVPAYMLSELKVGFLMGFRVYLPFLVIDMVIATILISMSMMMLPPVLISLPFKILLFVLVDGWTLVVGSLLESFVTPGHDANAASAAMFVILLCMRRRKAGPEPPLEDDHDRV